MNLNSIKIVPIIIILLTHLSVNVLAQTDTDVELTPKLDKYIETAFDAVKKNNWTEASKNFNEAIKEKKKIKFPSYFLYQKIVLSDEDRNAEVTDINVVKITFWRHSMGHEQALLTFLAFTEQLNGNTQEAENTLKKVYGMQSPVWGLSWRMFADEIHSLFFSLANPDTSENYARYLFMSGKLLIDAQDNRGIELIEQAQRRLPKDPDIAGRLADIYLMTGKTEESKKLSELSLSVKPKQVNVLINLANSNWILGNVDAAEKNAIEAVSLDPDRPGPHAVLVFVAIEKEDKLKAISEANLASKLSEKHIFYQTVLAAALAANGQTSEASLIMNETWGEDHPTAADLKHWFFRRKPLDLVIGLYNTKPSN